MKNTPLVVSSRVILPFFIVFGLIFYSGQNQVQATEAERENRANPSSRVIITDEEGRLVRHQERRAITPELKKFIIKQHPSAMILCRQEKDCECCTVGHIRKCFPPRCGG